MLDNQIFAVLVAALTAGFTALGAAIPGPVAVQQSYQPTTQGVNTQNTVFIHKIGDHRYGTVKRETYWEPDTDSGGTMVHKETQYYETTFQIDALAIQNPANVTQLTASDIVNYVAAIMQSDATLQTLYDNKLQILRIIDVRNPYFENDKNRFQASPSFDFTLEHEQVIISSGPVASRIIVNVDRV